MSGHPVTEWLQLGLAVVSGVVISAVAMLRTAYTFDRRIAIELAAIDRRLQRIENQNLEQIIGDQMGKERHDVLYPMLQRQCFDPIDKIEEELKKQGQNIAVLLERDRIGSGLQQLATTITNVANKTTEHDTSRGPR